MEGSHFVWGKLITPIILALSLGVHSLCFAEAKEQPINFDIPSQPLDLSLIAFSIQADVNVVGVTELLRQFQTPEVKGNLSWTAALDLLTENKRVNYQVVGDRSVSIILKDPSLTQDNYLEEIIVTAEGRSKDLQKTPIAVTVVHQEQLYESKIDDLLGLAKLVPGLEMTSTTPQAAILVQLRGVGTTNITEIADGPVSIHIDGIYSPRSQGAAALLHDIDSVEVLRGPQGTLFGRNASAGSINIHNRQPQLDELQSTLTFGLGSYQQKEFRGALNIPLGDTLAIRLAAATNKHDAYTDLLDNYVGLGQQHPQDISELTDFDRSLDLGQQGPEAADQSSARISGLWQPQPEISAFVSFERYTDRGTGIAELDPTLVNQGIRGVVIDSPIFLNLTNDVLRSQIEYDFDGYKLRYILGHSTMKRQQIIDADNGWSSSFEQQRTFSSNFRFVSNEIQLISNDLGRTEWLTGLYASREKNSIIFAVDQQNSGGGRFPDGATSWINDFEGGAVSYAMQPDRRVNSLGVYSQAVYSLDDSSRMTFGLRYTKDRKSDSGGRAINCRVTSMSGPYVTSDSIANSGPTPEQIYADPATQQAIHIGTFHDNGTSDGIGDQPCWIRQVNDIEVSWENVSGLLRYDYSPREGLMYYGSISTGFKSGHIQDAGNSAKPETVTNFELGLKSQFLNDSLRVNAALFQADYDNLQFSNQDRLDINNDGVADTGGSTVVRNASEAKIRGLEIDLEWILSDLDHLQFTAAVTDAHFDRFTIPDTLFGDLFNPFVSAQSSSVIDSVDLSGNVPPRVPKWKFTAAYKHDFLQANGVLSPRVIATFSDHYYLDIYNRDTLAPGILDRLPDGGRDLGIQDSFMLIDLGLSYKPYSKNWQVSAYLNNALDENVKIASGNVITEEGFVATYLPPKTYGIRVNYSF